MELKDYIHTHPYTISKGENFVVKNIILLYANSMNGKQSF
jgi:hypothetical protein